MSEATTILLHSPEEVKLNKYQHMPPLDDAAYADLREDIAENGILSAILLDADRWVIDGHHRIKAWKELLEEGQGPNAVPARVFPDIDEDRARDLSISVNTLTRQFTAEQKDELARKIFISKAQHFAKVYGYERFSVEEEEGATNFSPRRVSRMVRRQPCFVAEVLQEMVEEGIIPQPAYYYRLMYNPATGIMMDTRNPVPVPSKSDTVEVDEPELVPVRPEPPAITINDQDFPLASFEPETTIEDITQGRVVLPSYPQTSKEEKALEKLHAARRATRALVPANVAAVPSNRAQAETEVGPFTVHLQWLEEFVTELKKKSKGRLKVAR